MVLTVSLPSEYPFVLVATTIVPFVANMCMGGLVMAARRRCEVPYPNLYATPGFHKNAEEFNRVQRGHQSMFETMPNMVIMALVGGITYPLATTACAVLYSLGNFLYLIGYSDMNLNVRNARYMRGGGLKQVGLYGCFLTCCGAIWTLLQQA